MKVMKIKYVPLIIFVTALIPSFLLLNTILLPSFPPVNGVVPTDGNSKLPVLLIHGYLSDASVWSKWEDLLKKDGIIFYPITYKSDDRCGSAAEHAKELNMQVQQILKDTEKNGFTKKINIVGHSKGGLDARVFLANSSYSANTAVANLIMIGTANAGSPLANTNDICSPAVQDLRPGAADTKAERNQNTNYYTIYGDWNPSLLMNCPQKEWLPVATTGYFELIGKEGINDGIVPVSSVQSQPYFIDLGHTSDCHSNLLGEDEYNLARGILLK
jgi:triacylglycerol lipase